MSDEIRNRYHQITANLATEDLLETDRIAAGLRALGWPYSNRSLVLREAVGCLSEALRGKSAAGAVSQALLDADGLIQATVKSATEDLRDDLAREIVRMPPAHRGAAATRRSARCSRSASATVSSASPSTAIGVTLSGARNDARSHFGHRVLRLCER